MNLRPENLLALQTAFIPPSVLLHPELLGIQPIELASQGVKFALVDHNSLLPMFGQGQGQGQGQAEVEAIIDHHDDEGQHAGADRLVQVPTGSSASLVTKYFRSQWEAALSSPPGIKGSPVPPELATLLLSAIVIDTGGLKDGGKATPTDHESASFLYPLSTFNTGESQSQSQSQSPDQLETTSTSFPPANLLEYSSNLAKVKFDVSGLTTHDLLLRDYKEYKLSTASTSFRYLQVGLSTVPMGLKVWLQKESAEDESSGWEKYMQGIDRYMEERNLDIEGVLTTFKSEKKGKNKRELLLVVRSGGAIKSSEEAKQVRDELVEGLEASAELELAAWGEKGGVAGKLKKKAKVGMGLLDGGHGGRWGVVWKQGNTRATRKQVAPLMVSTLCAACSICFGTEA
jgi:exopolyphosphatase